MTSRAVRGAITVSSNDQESILKATEELLSEIVSSNNITVEDIVSVIFSTTPDLTAAFPAAAARRLGWRLVPLMGVAEADVLGGLGMCIRVLLTFNTDKTQADIIHKYLGGAAVLRPDIA